MVHRSLSFSPSIHVAFLVHFPCRRCPRHFQETGDVRGTLDRMPAYKTRERMVLKSLHRHGADPVTFSPFWFTIRTFYLVFLFFRGERQGKGVGGRWEGGGERESWERIHYWDPYERTHCRQRNAYKNMTFAKFLLPFQPWLKFQFPGKHAPNPPSWRMHPHFRTHSTVPDTD